MTEPSDADGDPMAAFETVARRRSLLAALTAEPHSKADLVRTLSVSRSTVDRGVDDLRELGLVTVDEGRVRLTNAGRAALRVYDETVGTFSQLLDATALLDRLPDGRTVPPALFRDAAVCTAAPTSLEDRLADRLDDVTALDCFNGPYRFGLSADAREMLASLGDRARCVLSEETVSWLSTQYGADLDALVAAGVDVVSVPESSRYGVSVVEFEDGASVTLSVYDHMGSLEGLIESTSPRAVRWGRDVVAEWAATGTPSPGRVGDDY